MIFFLDSDYLCLVSCIEIDVKKYFVSKYLKVCFVVECLNFFNNSCWSSRGILDIYHHYLKRLVAREKKYFFNCFPFDKKNHDIIMSAKSNNLQTCNSMKTRGAKLQFQALYIYFCS